MESIRKTFRVLRTNWKKSIFGSICVFYGGKFLHSKYRENLYLREVCLEAKSYGDAALPNDARPRHVTVILNPTANDGKCKAQFDKYCGPLLNLAGLRVGIIKTEKEGQAKELMEIMDNTDAVVIAGGDGTVAEAVTGLLRRSDRAAAVRRLPLAVVPLGRTNSAAAALLPGWEGADAARRVTQATLALIRDTLRPLDVMEVQALETEAEIPGRPVYLLSDVWWGAYRDVYAKTHNYWYWGALKSRAAYLLNVFRGLTWRCDADMEYTQYCGGCSRCHCRQQQEQQPPPQESRPAPGRWWTRFLPQPKPTPQPNKEPEVDYSSIENAECGVWRRQRVGGVEWRLRPSHASVDGQPGLHLSLGPESLTAAEFVQEGWRRVSGEQPVAAQRLVVGEVRLIPAPEVRSAAAQRPVALSENSSATSESAPDSGATSESGPDSGATLYSTSAGGDTVSTAVESPVPVTTPDAAEATTGEPATVAASAQDSPIIEKDASDGPIAEKDASDSPLIGKDASDSPTVGKNASDAPTAGKDVANTRWFSFDSEEFEVRPVHIRLLPKAVRVFASSPQQPTAAS